MSTELIINASLPETRIALMENGEIQEILVERAEGKGIVGNIYKGRVTRVLPGMQAAFVDIGLEKAAFLYVDDVYQHSEIWEAEEGSSGSEAGSGSEPQAAPDETSGEEAVSEEAPAPASEEHSPEDSEEDSGQDSDESSEEDDEPVSMSAEGEGGGGGEGGGDAPSGTVAPGASGGEGSGGRGNRQRRGRRGGRNRKRGPRDRGAPGTSGEGAQAAGGEKPEAFQEQMEDEGYVDSDRSELADQGGEFSAPQGGAEGEEGAAGRPTAPAPAQQARTGGGSQGGGSRPEFRENRDKFRRIKSRGGRDGSRSSQSGHSGSGSGASSRGQVNIQDLLKEGQEVLVQVAKDPIATKGARLTCHISLPGRHLVCMPTIDHVGVSKRIERDDERRRLRDFVERNRPSGLGFIVRTASGKQQSERRLKQDMEYLSRLWEEIQEKARNVSAPALVYEDLNAVLRAIRDWVNEEIDRIVVDSRFQYNDIQRFVTHFMPSLRQKVELYQGDMPIFDHFNISSELSRALDRKVWLKSGGYIVIDQAEALVAIDVNTGRFVGKKNLEDTIVKTNLEAVQEIAYQLRLRNCGGIIILDLIDMDREESKQRVYRALEEALKKDRARPTIQKISDLGLIEMTRKRTRDTMVRMLCESCSHCEGKGFVKSRQTVAYEVLRDVERDGIDRDVRKVLVQAHTEVIDLLALDERDTLDQLERRYRKPIFLQAMHDFHLEQFEVIADRAPGAKAKDRVGKQGERERRAERMAERQRERDQREKERQAEREAVRARLDAQRQSQALAGATSHEAPVDAGDFMAEEGQQQTEAPQAHAGGEQREGGRERHPRGQDRGHDRGHDRNRHRDRDRGRHSSQQEMDPDSIGNRVDYKPKGRNAQNYFYQGDIIPGTQPPQQYEGLPQDEEMTEEDRRAFLRAQALQDNAIAKMSQQGGGFVPGKPQGQTRGGEGRGGDRGDRGGDRGGGRRGRRGRRGGRGRHDRGGRDFGGGNRGDSAGNGGGNGGGAGNSGGSSGSGGDSGGGGGGGGGDFSPPPV